MVPPFDTVTSVSHASPFSIMETERGEELLARKEIYTEKNLAAVSDQKNSATGAAYVPIISCLLTPGKKDIISYGPSVEVFAQPQCWQES